MSSHLLLLLICLLTSLCRKSRTPTRIGINISRRNDSSIRSTDLREVWTAQVSPTDLLSLTGNPEEFVIQFTPEERSWLAKNRLLWLWICSSQSVDKYGRGMKPRCIVHPLGKFYDVQLPIVEDDPEEATQQVNDTETETETETESSEVNGTGTVADNAPPSVSSSSWVKETTSVQELYVEEEILVHFVPLPGGPGAPNLQKTPIPGIRQTLLVDDTLVFGVVYLNRFWSIRSQMRKVSLKRDEAMLDLLLSDEDSTEILEREVVVSNVTLRWSTLSFFWFQLYEQTSAAFQMQLSVMGMREREIEELKSILVDNPPWLLFLTFGVSMLHSLFDYLAFRSDITFWRRRRSLRGISVWTVLWNAFANIIIFLYLWDHDTSWTVLLSTGMGVLMSLWKITKAFEVVSWFPPKVKLAHRDYEESQTGKHDSQAMKWLMLYCFAPLSVLYAIYALKYKSFRGWYSFIISTAVGFIYLYGFMMMLPQLYINYKLQSVAHMNGKTMTYKVLNTFIDDLFAVVVKMPLLHKIATLRDDVVFFIYLYQRWIYREDPNRPNEFGQVGVPETDAPPPELKPGVEISESELPQEIEDPPEIEPEIRHRSIRNDDDDSHTDSEVREEADGDEEIQVKRVGEE